MRLVLGVAILALGLTSASAQYLGYGNGMSGTGSNPNSHYVQPHYNSNGTYTSGHYQTKPNGTQFDNFGTRGNYNYTNGTYGTRGAYR